MASIGKGTKSDGDADELHARNDGGDAKSKSGVMASSVFNQSLSSGSSASISNKKTATFNMSMEDFNESFKSMEVEDRGGGGRHPQGRLPDPDGAVAGGQRHPGGMALPSRSKGSRKDPSGGRLGTIHSSRSSQGAGASPSSAAASASAANHANVRLSSNAGTAERRESLGQSDLDMLGSATHGNDFGVSLDSLRSFQSVQSGNSDASSWLNQYGSMENVGGKQDPWEDEDRASASDGTSMSEISAPRMVTATGGGAAS